MRPVGKASVLLVDDKPANLLALEAILEPLELNLVSARSGEEALKRLLEHEFAVILLDVQMPGLSGLTVAKLIKEREKTRHVPIIFLTASGDVDGILHGYSAGAVDYLLKPFAPELLRAKVCVFVDLYRLRLRAELLSAELTVANDELAATNLTVERERATLAAVVEGMTDGLVLVDSAGQIGYCNSRAGELLGVEPANLTDEPLSTVLELFEREASESAERLRACWERVLADPQNPPTLELRVGSSPPRELVVQFFAVAQLGVSNAGVCLLVRDVSAERSLARAKDELVSIVSHELRSPLASIVGFTELLLTRPFDEPERKRMLSLVREASRSLTALVDEFLDLQRLQRGLQIAPSEIDLRPVLDRAAALASHDSDHPLRLELPDEPLLVRADPPRIEQVLDNLLSNARKYSPAGGEIVVSARGSEAFVELAVDDHGLGIPSEELSRLFQEFYRVEHPDRRTIKGTGLGLAICRQIVLAHGGEIWAESAGLGHGARFAFTLPSAVPNQPRPGNDRVSHDGDAPQISPHL